MSLNLHDKYSNWLAKWHKDNVTPQMAGQCEDWLMGQAKDLKPCNTNRDCRKNPGKAPYYEYNKYWVEYLEPRPVPAVTQVQQSQRNTPSPANTTPTPATSATPAAPTPPQPAPTQPPV